MCKQYQNAISRIRDHWRIYGGWPALRSSPYFHAALALTAILIPAWRNGGWTTQAIDVLPGLIGFSLGGFAIWLAFGDGKFMERLAGKEPGETQGTTSPYIDASAAFAHFIVVQIFALIYAIIANTYAPYVHAYGPVLGWVIHGIGFLLYAYGLSAVLAATYTVFSMTCHYDDYVGFQREAASNQEPEPDQPDPSHPSAPPPPAPPEQATPPEAPEST